MALFPFPLRRADGHRPVLGDRRGAVIVEFALVAAPFMALIFAALLASLAYLAQEALESAVEVAARGIVTGQTQANDIQKLAQGLTRPQLAEQFRRKGCEQLPGFMSCERLYVDVKTVPSRSSLLKDVLDLALNAAGQPKTALSYDLGGQGAIVMVRFIYRWPLPIAPTASLNPMGAGSAVLVATSVAKSESYN